MTIKPKALLFDTFGTVVDWRGSVAREGARLGALKELKAIDWDTFARDWRRGYQPGMEPVRRGERPFTSIDVIHRERLDVILEEYNIADVFNESEKVDFNLIWHRLDPWPDSVPGLRKIAEDFLISPLSNGSTILLASMAKRAGISWDFVFASDTFRAFKPDPAVYNGAVRILGLEPHEVMMVAAHNDDLHAARACGLKTAYINRPYEYGIEQSKDFEADDDWDFIANTIEELANKLRG